MKALFVCVIALVGGLVATEQGRTCSRPALVTPLEPRAVVAGADAAFIGTLAAVRPKDPPAPSSGPPYIVSSGAPHIFTFVVEEPIKGDLGERVDVVSARGGASCGLDGTIGRRGAYLLSRRNGEWGLSAVGEVSPELLRRGVLPLPEPDGVGPAVFVAAGHFGAVRTATLDSRGRTLAYGRGGGAVTALSICPGRKVVVELVRAGESVRVAQRALPSLRLLRETELRPRGYGESVSCRSRTGADVLASVYAPQQPESETQLLHVTPVGTLIVERAPRLAAAVRGEHVAISLSDGRLLLRDLATGTSRTLLGTGRLLTGMSISPDRRFVTGFTGERLVVADLLERKVRAKQWAGSRNQTTWVGPRTFTAWSAGRLELLDHTLRPLRAGWAWPAHTTTVSSAGVFGVDWAGGFLTERDGFIVRLGQLFSPAVSELEPL